MAATLTSTKRGKKLVDETSSALRGTKPPSKTSHATPEDIAAIEQFKMLLLENGGKHTFEGVDE